MPGMSAKDVKMTSRPLDAMNKTLSDTNNERQSLIISKLFQIILHLFVYNEILSLGKEFINFDFFFLKH